MSAGTAADGIRHRGLRFEEPLIFEQGADGRTGVDLPDPPEVRDRLGGLAREAPIGLPGLSEPQVVRHFTRLSQKNYAIDTGLYPLGSCTMKHNPRLNEKLARLPGFADIHPLQPESTIQGALALMDRLTGWLTALTGMPAIALSPAAGAHGEWTGLMTIRSAHEAAGDPRKRVLVPDSAHGTNPASAAMCGYEVAAVPLNGRGRVDLEALKSALGDDVAAFMLTNPNTCGLFEDEILEQADAVHEAGRLFLLRRRQFQRHRRPGAARRPRHRLHAPQPAQDVLDAARRGRAGQRTGRAVRGARAPRAGSLCRRGAGRIPAGRDRPLRPGVRAGEGVPRPDGHVRPRARLHPEPRHRRAPAGVVRRGPERELRLGRARRPDEPPLRGAVHARGPVRRRVPHGHRGDDARSRQGDDRRGVPPGDDLFPAGGPRRAASGTHRDGIEGEPRPPDRNAAADRGAGRWRATPMPSMPRPGKRRAAGSTRPRPRAAPSCAGARQRRKIRPPSDCREDDGGTQFRAGRRRDHGQGARPQPSRERFRALRP